LICPVCEQGTLRAENYSDTFDYNGRALVVVGLARHRCDRCDADPVLRDQIRQNQVLICDAKREADGLLTSTRIRAIRELLGMSQAQAAAAFGGGANAFSKYERCETIQSVPMDRLLRSAARIPAVAQFLENFVAGKEPEFLDIRGAMPATSTWTGWQSDVPMRANSETSVKFAITAAVDAANHSFYRRVEEVGHA
jgi:putative zinc finger/helix-turn-helix YgiT family protein